ncbi:MAG: NAD(P)/FAD-dependent oxidoreductase [Micropepsaceae bacterium]
MKITRRDFGRISASLPVLFGSPLMANPDVVVIGAGVAGLAAAQVLVDAGKRVQIVEAAPRVGGRCYTDTASFGMPFDQGAMWLRDADHNPLFGFARLFRFETSLAQPKEMLFSNGHLVSPGANEAYERAFDALSMALADVAENEGDVAASAVHWPDVDDASQDWLPTAATQIGPLDVGVDLEQISVKDWFYRADSEPSRLVKQGVGTLIARLAAGLPISISTSAYRVVAEPRGTVSVYTSKGTISAAAAIITVSTGVLAAGSISIEPALTADMQSALSKLQMGSLLKIAYSFEHTSPTVMFPPNSVLLAQAADQRGTEFLVRPFGVPMAICSVGGSLAVDLESQNDKTRFEFGRESLRSMLGTDADKGLLSSASTNWGRNPLVFGSVACAKPGGLQAREVLQGSINDRVFLAGEALGGKAVQTVHGAYESGRSSARRVISLLKRKSAS